MEDKVDADVIKKNVFFSKCHDVFQAYHWGKKEGRRGYGGGKLGQHTTDSQGKNGRPSVHRNFYRGTYPPPFPRNGLEMGGVS